jgi:hypothetical protein
MTMPSILASLAATAEADVTSDGLAGVGDDGHRMRCGVVRGAARCDDAADSRRRLGRPPWTLRVRAG